MMQTRSAIREWWPTRGGVLPTTRAGGSEDGNPWNYEATAVGGLAFTARLRESGGNREHRASAKNG